MSEGPSTYIFDDFHLDALRRILTRSDGSAVDITPKAVDILCTLVENAGAVVSKDELIQRVWPDSFVEEANLSHHIFKLRKALGETPDHKLIETVSKRGYRFVGLIENNSDPLPEIHLSGGNEQPQRLPEPRAADRKYWKPVLAVATILALAGAAIFFYRTRGRSETPSTAPNAVRSIAVLPFVNESGSEDVEYLADGMTETLIAGLSQAGTIAVKPHTLVRKYKGADVSAKQVASDLGVEGVLFGRITQRGDQITLFLSLIDPTNEFQIWGKQYSRKLTELSALQTEIGRDVALSVEARLTGVDERALTKSYSQNAEAYRLYLLGDYHWAKFTEKNFWIAKKYYEDALAIDPNYALAYTGLANTYSVLGVNGFIPVEDGRQGSKAAAEQAIRLDDQLAEAHLALGAYRMFFEWDLHGADTEYQRALQLQPTYAVPHELMAYSLRARLKHSEAIAEAKKATELDPLHLLMLGDLGTCYRFAGKVEDAIRINQTVMEMDPGFGDVYGENALALSQRGDHAEAIRQAKKGFELTGGSKAKAIVGIVYARSGDRPQAGMVIRDLLAARYVSTLDVALIYAALADRDKAFEWLEKAYTARTPWLFELNVDPTFAPIKDDPRFADLLDRIGVNK
jgi:DNA-binding winged helix-turn-helix (wHTH) protein/TolB-like protein/Tfp pilus assembly protein PilF